MDTIGGAQTHVRDLVLQMKKEGHEIFLITGGGRHLYDELRNSQIPTFYSKSLIRNFNIIKDFKAFFELRKLIKAIKPDIIATHSSKAGVLGRFASWSLCIPTVFTAHGWAFTEGVSKKKTFLYKIVEKVTGKITDGIITVSEYDRQLALRYKIKRESKIVTIHNGIHEQKVPISKAQQPKGINLLMVARFSPPKQQIQLIQALNEIRHLNWTMYFAGDGPLLQKCRQVALGLELTERIFFLGNRNDIEELLTKSDIFILLSDWEGLPISILEAMRHGLPVVATDVGGVKEAVQDGVNGYLLPKGSRKCLIEKLTHLLINPELQTKMGNEGSTRFRNDFTFDLMYRNTVFFYENILQINLPERVENEQI